MPLINIFLWTILLLVALLGIQLVLFERQAERQAARQSAGQGRASDIGRLRDSQTVRRTSLITQKKLHGFMPVGNNEQSAEGEGISYWLPSTKTQLRTVEKQKEAAEPDCFHCA